MTVTQAQLDSLWDFGDPAGSEQRLRAAAETTADAATTAFPTASARTAGASRGASDLVGPAATRAELETQVARALGLQERFADAEAVLDAIPPEVAAASAAVRVRIPLERGRLRNSSGDPDAAIPLFREAAEAAASVLVFLQVDALHMLAIADAEHAAHWTAQALAVLEGVSDPRTLRWRVSLHNNAGWTHYDAGRLAEAVTEFERAKDAATRWGTPQQIAWADEALAEARAVLAD